MNISSVHPRKTMISKKEVICTNVHIHVGEKMLYISNSPFNSIHCCIIVSSHIIIIPINRACWSMYLGRGNY